MSLRMVETSCGVHTDNESFARRSSHSSLHILLHSSCHNPTHAATPFRTPFFSHISPRSSPPSPPSRPASPRIPPCTSSYMSPNPYPHISPNNSIHPFSQPILARPPYSCPYTVPWPNAAPGPSHQSSAPPSAYLVKARKLALGSDEANKQERKSLTWMRRVSTEHVGRHVRWRWCETRGR